jgi:hypothetical protein
MSFQLFVINRAVLRLFYYEKRLKRCFGHFFIKKKNRTGIAFSVRFFDLITYQNTLPSAANLSCDLTDR